MANSEQANGGSSKFKVQHVNLEDIVENDVEPPPLHLISEFKTLHEWLLNIYENDKPQKLITKYRFGLFESPNDYTLFLVGVNTYEEEQNRSITRVEFVPENMYFRLPETYYNSLNREQLLDKLTFQLKDLLNTEKFETSFLAKANIVVFDTNGETIWSKTIQ
jgi:hypothetical protein